MLAKLRDAGMNIGEPAIEYRARLDDFPVRMNFSHGSYEYHQSVIDNTRKAVQCLCPCRSRFSRRMLTLVHSSGPTWKAVGYRAGHRT